MKSVEKNADRIMWIDTARGIGICLVILGHAIRDAMREQYPFWDFIYFFIYTFHMHFFFFLSGYIYARREDGSKSIQEYIGGRVRRLLVPWAVFSALVYGIVWGMNQHPLIKGMLDDTFLELISPVQYLKMGVSGINPYCTHVWYMYALLIIQVLIFLIQKFYRKWFKKEREPTGFWIVLEMLSILSFLFIWTDVKIILLVTTYIIYYVFGIMCSRGWWNGTGVHEVFLLLPGTALCCLNVLALNWDLCTEELVRRFIYNLTSFAGVPFMILGLCMIAKKVNGKSKALNYLGKNSFLIYLLHQPFACAVLGIVLTKVLPVTLPTCVLIIFICAAVSIGFPAGIRKLSSRIGMGWILSVMLGEKQGGTKG